MENFNDFKSWRSNHSTIMRDLTYAKPDDVFIFTSFTDEVSGIDQKEVLYATDYCEAMGYFRHIFLYDLLVDATDDMQLDEALRTEQRQGDALFLLNLWFKVGKALHKNLSQRELKTFCKEFNTHFNNRIELKYEFHLLMGADELRKFLILKFKSDGNFNTRRLENICSKELFVGKVLNDFLIDYL